MITYAAEVQGHRACIHQFKTVLDTLSRPFLRRLANAQATVYTRAMEVLAGCPPLWLEVYYKATSVLQEDSKLFCEQDYEVPVPFSFFGHLAGRPDQILCNFKDLIVEGEEAFQIFTDGSKSSKNVGAAFVFKSSTGQNVYARRAKLREQCNIFQAECFAIHMALQWAILANVKLIVICSDSLTVFTAIVNLKQ